MESTAAPPTFAVTATIADAFPQLLKAQANGLVSVTGSVRFATHQGIKVRVNDDNLIIPYRSIPRTMSWLANYCLEYRTSCTRAFLEGSPTAMCASINLSVFSPFPNPGSFIRDNPR